MAEAQFVCFDENGDFLGMDTNARPGLSTTCMDVRLVWQYIAEERQNRAALIDILEASEPRSHEDPRRGQPNDPVKLRRIIRRCRMIANRALKKSLTDQGWEEEDEHGCSRSD